MVVPTYETTAKEQEMIINELRSINRTQENRINIQKEEIKELNNIINELEKWLEDVDIFQMNFIKNKKHITPYKAVLDKLQELKGSDK